MEKLKSLFLDYKYAKNTNEKYYDIFDVDSTDFAQIKLSELNLSVRATNILNNMSLYTLEDILNFYPSKIACFEGCGRKTFKEINIALLKLLKGKEKIKQIKDAIDECEKVYNYFKTLADKIIIFDINEIKCLETSETLNVAAIELGIAFEKFIEDYSSTNRQKEIIRKRFKIDILPKCTLERISQDYNISRERVRQLINKELNRISSLNETLAKTNYFMKAKNILLGFNELDIYRLFSSNYFDLYNKHYVMGLLCSLFGRKNAHIIFGNIEKIFINNRNYNTFQSNQINIYKKIEEEREKLSNLIYFPRAKQAFNGSIKKLPQLREINVDNGFFTGYMSLNKAYLEVPFESGSERRVFEYLDNNSYVTEINAQCICIPYADKRNYYPDIVIKTEDNALCIIEVKPFYQMALYENLLKFEALHNYCKEKNIGYLIIDERINSLFQYKNNISNAKLEKMILEELSLNENINYTRYRDLLSANNLDVTIKELSVVVLKNKLKWSLKPFSIKK